MKLRKKPVALVLALIAGLLLVSVASAASNGQGKGNGNSNHDDVLAYWTADRVAGAKARDIILEIGPNGLQPQDKPDNPGGGNGNGGGGGGGNGKPDNGDGSVSGSEWNDGGSVVATTGRVLFTMGGSDWVCSASVVDDGNNANKSVVVTAGHCVWDDTDLYATNWAFVSDYDSVGTFSGCISETSNCWVADELIAPAEWRAAGNDYNNDFAFAVFTTGNQAGVMLDTFVGGGQEIVFPSVPALPREIYAFGYPAEAKYKGDELIYCAGTDFADPLDGNVGDPRGIECKMNGGSSGGPWMIDFDNDPDSDDFGTGKINGVTSYSYPTLKNALFGPIFGSIAEVNYNLAIAP